MDQETQTIRCDVCVVGAGIAGLNALFAASRHLGRDQRVVLVDRRPLVGGMWVDTYDYVRLHQPHSLFTAGNIPWTLDAPREHLASKQEVLDHLRHCLDEIARRVPVTELLGWELEDAVEDADGVRATCRAADGRRAEVHADRLVKAYGFRVEVNAPLPLSSSSVRSVSPDFCDVRAPEVAADDAPVWVVGGGKTAMDTAHALLTANPRREVTLVAGAGTFFTSRDRVLPPGRWSWWRGTRPNAALAEMARRFDGTNEDEVLGWYRSAFGTWSTPQTRHFMFGVLSEAENEVIRTGVREILMDHVIDVVDRDGSTQMRLRSGDTRAVAPGSWVVNCTGYLKPHEGLDHEPYVSPGGRTATVTTRSTVLGFSSFGAYFLGHLLMLGRLGELPLYELDAEALLARCKPAIMPTAASLGQLNLGLILDAVPTKVFAEWGTDFDRWYPAPRRLVGQAQFLRQHKRERAHHMRSLDTVRERFDIRCGPLVHERGAALS